MILAQALPPSRRLCSLALCALAGCQTAAPPPPTPHAEVVRGELTHIVDAQPGPCGAVLTYRREHRLDYRVECQSGHAYRVRVGADGGVSVRPALPAASAAR